MALAEAEARSRFVVFLLVTISNRTCHAIADQSPITNHQFLQTSDLLSLSNHCIPFPTIPTFLPPSLLISAPPTLAFQHLLPSNTLNGPTLLPEERTLHYTSKAIGAWVIGMSVTQGAKPDIDRYLVIHVATTCDEHGVYVTKDSAEVIEIGWLLLDAKNCEEVGEGDALDERDQLTHMQYHRSIERVFLSSLSTLPLLRFAVSVTRTPHQTLYYLPYPLPLG